MWRNLGRHAANQEDKHKKGYRELNRRHELVDKIMRGNFGFMRDFFLLRTISLKSMGKGMSCDIKKPKTTT